MDMTQLIQQLNAEPNALVFTDVIAAIDAAYAYTPTAFSNGDVNNAAGTNEGSCKVFAAAKLLGLSESHTLRCFAEHYQKVVDTPNDTDHANIRNFMVHGWAGVSFESEPLVAR